MNLDLLVNWNTTFMERGVPWHRIGAIEWDGVISIFPHPSAGEAPLPGAMDGIQKLLNAGWRLEIYACNFRFTQDREQAIRLLEAWSAEFLNSPVGFLSMYVDQINFPIYKPGAKWYLDGRGYKFSDWEDFTPEVAEAFRACWQDEDEGY